ncbi:PepSY domain-containing protein [Ferdinandcohnia quinoae]|uniref:PepSY domain-containing protein n=1 Tax=Fredinandcohnia quinoae TaxID=2918902 RepID=A0AAW5EC42_9BACI|nr:PepSY domain-containing protein [Fredinandcohnia sp. SECRCQ15]MCH1627026.1 PepSY domain-containing protein [Fredinandcohnia sp. SECRCQ15]
MKQKLLILGIAGVVLLGGAMGAEAFYDKKKDLATIKEANLISMEKAEKIAIEKVGGTVKSIELDRDNGAYKYEIEVNHKDSYDDIDLDIDAKSGEIIMDDDDDLNDFDDDNLNVISKSEKIISKEEAVAIATKDTPGKITEVDLDDDGYYEIEMRHEGYEIDYKIDVFTGEILKKEVDR